MFKKVLHFYYIQIRKVTGVLERYKIYGIEFFFHKEQRVPYGCKLCPQVVSWLPLGLINYNTKTFSSGLLV